MEVCVYSEARERWTVWTCFLFSISCSFQLLRVFISFIFISCLFFTYIFFSYSVFFLLFSFPLFLVRQSVQHSLPFFSFSFSQTSHFFLLFCVFPPVFFSPTPCSPVSLPFSSFFFPFPFHKHHIFSF